MTFVKQKHTQSQNEGIKQEEEPLLLVIIEALKGAGPCAKASLPRTRDIISRVFFYARPPPDIDFL